YDVDDNGDKDGDAEKAMEQSYQREYSWREDRIGESPETVYIRKETREEMLGRMTDRQREVFLLYYRDGFNQREIAQLLGISQQKVSKRLSAALANAKRNFDFF
ncbi:MAG TPA: sigma-70 family RNA polymerase sigma factor, partial [Lachnospiraceae bacterium]|nr:sigma-70 family RNA polymerase sigma factor [Lachnospiraceae bacterium]